MSVRIDCWCITCDEVIADAVDENDPDSLAWLQRPFLVCPDCGNKRCPKATHHNLACTGSNEPGQPGSAYAQTVAPPSSVQELRDRLLANPTHRRVLDAEARPSAG